MTLSFPPSISTSTSTSIGSASPHSGERAAVGSESGSRVRSGSGVMWLADSELNKLNSWEEGRQREGQGQGQGGVSGLYVDTARRTSSAAVTLLPDGAATAATTCKSGSASGAAASVSAQSGAGTALTDWDTQTTPCRRGARSAHGSFCQEQEQEEEDVDDEEDDDEDDSDDEEVDEDEGDRIDSRDEEDEEEEDGYESGFSEGTHLRKLDAERGGLGMGGAEGLSPMEVYEAVTAKVRVCGLEQFNVDMCDAT